MSKEDLDQTLIPKDDEEQWRKVLHGEMVSAEELFNVARVKDANCERKLEALRVSFCIIKFWIEPNTLKMKCGFI